MYAVVRQTDYGSTIFFITWIIVGKQHGWAGLGSCPSKQDIKHHCFQGASPCADTRTCTCTCPAGKYIFLTLFLAVTLEAFEAKYDALAVRAGMKQGGISSIFSKLSSRLSSFGNSFKR